jgi:hypothetical protein
MGSKPLSKRRNLARKIFGDLTVTTKWRPTGDRVEWLCRCTCGRQSWVRSDNLTGGRTKSCGIAHEFADAGLEQVNAS